ncbi:MULTISPECIES: hypothetical protein [Halobacteriovorax]|uniref:Flagellar operon protein n=1 Tax=Halobacteriovorax vibrionivorans TaxID=2152716 RepID=A0ABY0IDQ2_9BACT|nr:MULTISPECIES: hypothetical protein [Halobacteriovorax]AYF45023.1 putative flagellar operon protein [Halobacteriovorax sp. BALOs_7]RZF21086.1 hypothetical protein DAY19_13990 [Halobacteriovorax vibrionivorans]TGD47028.1 hypothetical protein EP118_09665 [Halobacteriovorax sp. Y22]
MERVINQLSISKHAQKRMSQRQIELNDRDLFKLSEAAMKLKAKGSHESLIITPIAAFILDIDHHCLITAIHSDEMNENIFTKIDATMIVN